MTTRNFDALFAPRAIALVGASNRPGAVGEVLARNLYAGGFAGPIMPVNPHESSIRSAVNYKSVADLPITPDLAVIATPAPAIPGLIAELGARGCRAAIVISTGFSHAGPSPTHQDLLNAARPHLMRIVGPNCLGVLSSATGVNASFSHVSPLKGRIALVTQSGAIATSMLDWANGRGVGFSHIISLGEMSDVDFGDVLDFLALDRGTESILLYVENVTSPRKFISAGRIASRAKPVIVVKSGRGAMAAAAAASHSGALSGSDIVYDAVFRRAGMLRVGSLRDLLDATAILASGARVRGDRLTIVTNGGGLGVLATDALEQAGGRLSALSDVTRKALDAALPAAWSHANPIDILGDADGERYTRAVAAAFAQGDQDAILVMNCPTGVASNLDAAAATARARPAQTLTPMLACWMGDATTDAPRRLLAEARIPNYETPDEAVRAFMQLVEYDRGQRALREAPAASLARDPDAAARVRTILRAVLADGRTLLTSPEAQDVLSAYGVPCVETKIAKHPADAAKEARALTGPVVLKLLSRDISHKSDVGGVRLGLSAAEVQQAAEEMLAAVARAQPKARLDGFMLQPMVSRPHAQELILGLADDRTFGPTVLFGQGGVAVEVLRDRVIGLPPLNVTLARDMIEHTDVARLLRGYRDRAPADMSAIENALVSISDLVIECPEIAELDINPLLADDDGVLALDARIVVRAGPAESRLSIAPYPSQLARAFGASGGPALNLRPIRPEDEGALVAFSERVDPEDMRLRFHGPMRKLDHDLAARLSQIDYDREMAFLAFAPDQAIAGVVRLVFDPNYETAEYAIIVRSDLHRQGIGRALMDEAIAYARTRGATSMWGDILPENGPMLNLVRSMGAALTTAPDGGGIVTARFTLDQK